MAPSLRRLAQSYKLNTTEANDHILTYLDRDQNFDFWYDFAYLSLAAGLEWAVLDALEATASEANFE